MSAKKGVGNTLLNNYAEKRAKILTTQPYPDNPIFYDHHVLDRRFGNSTKQRPDMTTNIEENIQQIWFYKMLVKTFGTRTSHLHKTA